MNRHWQVSLPVHRVRDPATTPALNGWLRVPPTLILACVLVLVVSRLSGGRNREWN